MRSAPHPPSSEGLAALVRRRAVALALVLAAHVGLVVMLLRLAPPTPASQPVVTTVELIAEPRARTETVAPPKAAREALARRSPPPSPRPAEEPPLDLDIIELTREEFAASDISRVPSQARGAPDAADESASAEAAGTGPNGERLYNAEWYREPTQAELAYYLPGGAPRSDWAMIACRTVDNFRVDDCVELGEAPAGSGLAAAIREAAWQFRVRPPRIGGRPLVGGWVRIRIDFRELPAK